MIRHTDVSGAMLNDVSGGTSFIRDFLVLFHACLIEPLQSGTANQSIVRSLENVDDVGNWNWCGFVIKCLEDAKTKWDLNRAAPFTGPLIFVTILYLDRFVMYNRRTVPRRFPAFIGWTMDLVVRREHEEVGFGKIGVGNVAGRQTLPKSSTVKEKQEGQNMSLSDHLMHMAQAIKLFYEHAQKLGPDSLDDEITKAVLESGKSLLGYTTTEDISTDAEVHLSQVGKLQSLSHDLFWKLPEQLKFVEAVEAAFYARKELIKEANKSQYFNDLHSATEIGGTSKSVVHPCSSKNTNVNPPIPSANAPKDAAPKPPLPKVTKKAGNVVQSVQVSSSEPTIPVQTTSATTSLASTVPSPKVIPTPLPTPNEVLPLDPIREEDINLPVLPPTESLLSEKEQQELASVIKTVAQPSSTSTLSKDKGKGKATIFKIKKSKVSQDSVS